MLRQEDDITDGISDKVSVPWKEMSVYNLLQTTIEEQLQMLWNVAQQTINWAEEGEV